jgi:hypothetical protein
MAITRPRNSPREGLPPRSRCHPRVEHLEDRRLLVAPLAEFIDPHPSPDDGFGEHIVPLSTGNVAITAQLDDAGGQDAGAVYLFNGATGALISTLTGSHPNDQVGEEGITALPSGNFVVNSFNWNSDSAANVGAVTFCSGISGLNGVVSSFNSLVGTKPGDFVGSNGVKVLTNGNYVVSSQNWDAGGLFLNVLRAGAVTFASGTSGISGPVTNVNSLVGNTADDLVGRNGVTALTNGNYVVNSPFWNGGVPTQHLGAATFGNGTTGVHGQVSTANSLIGTSPDDQVGVLTTALTNGNYVVNSFEWDNGSVVDAGAATFGNGMTGITGTVTVANSLVGSTLNDSIGNATALSNGNYVLTSQFWDNGALADVGAATFASGTTGISGPVSPSNSLIGSTPDDEVGSEGIVPLTNGNYVVLSSKWDNGGVQDVGAVTFCSVATGLSGVVSAANSLIGSGAGDNVGKFPVTPLFNGNYVVCNPLWSNGAVQQVGAATFASGTTGITGTISAANSLIGSTAGDRVGELGVAALTNGNYVVSSPEWTNNGLQGVGACTFGNGTSGIHGLVSAANSLTGTTANDGVGFMTGLTNGNYVVITRGWRNGTIARAGAVTFGDGKSGTRGAVSAANSLVGSTANDGISVGLLRLQNGGYVMASPQWDNGAIQDAGAATFGNGMTGVNDVISTTNSIIGAGGTTSISLNADNVNQTFICAFFPEDRVFVGSQTDGFAHPWHNGSRDNDVINDRHVFPNDALAVINYINAFGPGTVPPNAAIGQPFGFIDTNANDFVAPNDALQVINIINAGLGGEGESRQGTGDRGQETEEELLSLLALDMAEQTLQRRRL